MIDPENKHNAFVAEHENRICPGRADMRCASNSHTLGESRDNETSFEMDRVTEFFIHCEGNSQKNDTALDLSRHPLQDHKVVNETATKNLLQFFERHCHSTDNCARSDADADGTRHATSFPVCPGQDTPGMKQTTSFSVEDILNPKKFQGSSLSARRDRKRKGCAHLSRKGPADDISGK